MESGPPTNSFSFSLLFVNKKKILICLQGKPFYLYLCRVLRILLSSFQQLPWLGFRFLKGFLSWQGALQGQLTSPCAVPPDLELHGLSQMCRVRHRGPNTLLKWLMQTLNVCFEKHTFLYYTAILDCHKPKLTLCRIALVTRPLWTPQQSHHPGEVRWEAADVAKTRAAPRHLRHFRNPLGGQEQGAPGGRPQGLATNSFFYVSFL